MSCIFPPASAQVVYGSFSRHHQNSGFQEDCIASLQQNYGSALWNRFLLQNQHDFEMIHFIFQVKKVAARLYLKTTGFQTEPLPMTNRRIPLEAQTEVNFRTP